MSKGNLPQDNESERIILGRLISKPEVYFSKAKAEGVSERLFFNLIHKKLYSHLCEHWRDTASRGIDLDFTTFTAYLNDKGEVEHLGGRSYITEIATRYDRESWETHISQLKDRASRRDTLLLSAKIQEVAQSEPAEVALRTLAEGVKALRANHDSKTGFKNAGEAVGEFVNMLEDQSSKDSRKAGLSTGLEALDKVVRGLKSGNLIVIGGGTGAGKSVLSLQMASQVIKAGYPVLIYTLELGADEVIQRLVSCYGKIGMDNLNDIRRAPEGIKNRIKEVTQEISEKNILIDDTAGISIDRICNNAEIYGESEQVGLVLVDYIQLVSSERAGNQSRAEEVASISKRLKQLAKKLKCPVITPSQLNDQGRLRESRAIGQDADIVLNIINDGNTQALEVVKNRNGRSGEALSLSLNGLYQCFE